MSKLDLNSAYNSSGESVRDLFDKREEGFYVPLYQREYTWEEENINQLFEDIVAGVRELVAENGDNATTFLGTTILTDLSEKKRTVKSGEDRAQPTAVNLVIDGQQRIATIGLLAIQITECLKSLFASLPDADDGKPNETLKAHCDDLIDELRPLYALRLRRGANPEHKPKIIRAGEDKWTFSGDDSSYGSPVARYVGTYIRTNDLQKALESVDPVSGARVLGNVRLIGDWLKDISTAYISRSQLYEQFPGGSSIVRSKIQENVLGFSSETIEAAVTVSDTDSPENINHAAGIYNIFLFTFYLLKRCGVNRLQPAHEGWGFDMFQALNSTGTPLTALETFVPQIMREEERDGNELQRNPSKQYLDEIEELFESTTSNEQKNRRTNELLGTVSLCHSGDKLGNKFSRQRQWLVDVYDRKLTTMCEKRAFLANVARVADFYHSVWYMEDDHKPDLIKCVENHEEGRLASLLIQYLKSARSRLSAPILARYYGQIEDEEQSSIDEFVEAAKACAAFFTLWRSANSTSGLDDIYRRFFRDYTRNYLWEKNGGNLSANCLKDYFRGAICKKGIGDKESWMTASKRFLLYTEVKEICRFVLFIAGHDQIPDPHNPGLTIPGNKGTCDLLKLSQWRAKDFKSLEHVAPQRPPPSHSWDTDIYVDSKFHEIGNLLLLSRDINEFMDNKDWSVKYIHYSHVGSLSQQEATSAEKEAKDRGIVLSKRAAKALSLTRYSGTVAPLLTLGPEGPWNAEIIDRRSEQIKSIAWDILVSWLET